MKTLSLLLIPNLVLAVEKPAEFKQLQDTRQKKIKEINEQYVQALDRMKTKYTKQGELEVAVMIDDEIKVYQKKIKAHTKVQNLNVTVPSQGRSQTVTHKGKIIITPDKNSRWNSSPKRWGDTDYRGHKEGTKSKNGMRFMQLCYSLNNGKLVPIKEPLELNIDGSIFFAASDFEGGGSISNNTGSIKVAITLK